MGRDHGHGHEHGWPYYMFMRWTRYSKRAGWLYRWLEKRVPDYTLPPLLETEAGAPVTTPEAWRDARRPELLALFEREVYGRCPSPPAPLRYEVVEEGPALDGRAVRKQVVVALGPEPAEPAEPAPGVSPDAPPDAPTLDLLVYLPAEAPGPVPLFVGLNFYGNQTVQPDPAIRLPATWVRNNAAYGITANAATEASRGVRAYRWPVPDILARGFGVATAYYGDICPDRADGLAFGLPAAYRPADQDGPADQDRPADDAWGAISAWAWGLSRALDYFERDADVDATRVAVWGHSRLGKTALWAGARDPRFALVIANGSGCGGAALSRRCFGETVKLINERFPHWFCRNFHQYSANESALPVDQHMVLALSAPRPLYVGMADNDLWADPKGMFLSLQHADPAYRLLGTSGLPGGPNAELRLNAPLQGGTLGCHLRPGRHDVFAADWAQFLAFADHHFLSR